MAKVVLTGGTGYLGRALLPTPNIEWTVISRSEKAQLALRAQFPQVTFVVGDITDEGLLDRVFPGHVAVIHAAALKHVDLSEQEPRAYVRVNVEGSRAVVDAAVRHGLQIVALSTDKACEPANVYGLTKLLMERMVVEAGGACVRYGNVFGSDGSVLQAWERQWQESQVIRVTDPDMTRFFFRIEDAVAEVLRTWRAAPTGVVVPPLSATRMGDLAAAFLSVKGVGAQRVVGLRPGEKRHESLLSTEEGRHAVLWQGRRLLTRDVSDDPCGAWSSEHAPRLSWETLRTWLGALDTPPISTLADASPSG